MKLLLTGASGYLGKNITPILTKKYEISTLGIESTNTVVCNLSFQKPVIDKKYDIILHAAGKAHTTPRTLEEIEEFYNTNLNGTINLCTSLEKEGIPNSFIFVSTVAVYGVDFGELISEENPLNGNTPYALSKIQAEQYLTKWCNKHGVILGIIRPSLIAGPNPPGNLGAMIKGIKSGKYLSVSNGIARKSILMVQDIANIVPLLAEKGGIYNVCDNYNPSFGELEEIISKQLGKKRPISIPFWIAKCIALVGDCLGAKAPVNSLKLNKIVKSLTFSNEKAKKELGWEPLDVLSNFKIK